MPTLQFKPRCKDFIRTSAALCTIVMLCTLNANPASSTPHIKPSQNTDINAHSKRENAITPLYNNKNLPSSVLLQTALYNRDPHEKAIAIQKLQHHHNSNELDTLVSYFSRDYDRLDPILKAQLSATLLEHLLAKSNTTTLQKKIFTTACEHAVILTAHAQNHARQIANNIVKRLQYSDEIKAINCYLILLSHLQTNTWFPETLAIHDKLDKPQRQHLYRFWALQDHPTAVTTLIQYHSELDDDIKLLALSRTRNVEDPRLSPWAAQFIKSKNEQHAMIAIKYLQQNPSADAQHLLQLSAHDPRLSVKITAQKALQNTR